MGLGRPLLQSGKVAGRDEPVTEVARQESEQSRHPSRHGLHRYQIGHPDDALATYLKVETLYPKEPASIVIWQMNTPTASNGRKRIQEQAQVVSLLRDAYKGDDEQRTELANAYLSLSWYQLMVRDFSGALASSEAERKVDDTNLPLETNHAHALLFLGRTKDAEDLYLGYLGRKIGDKTWQQTILEDFDALEKEDALLLLPPPRLRACGPSCRQNNAAKFFPVHVALKLPPEALPHLTAARGGHVQGAAVEVAPPTPLQGHVSRAAPARRPGAAAARSSRGRRRRSGDAAPRRRPHRRPDRCTPGARRVDAYDHPSPSSASQPIAIRRSCSATPSVPAMWS